MLTRDPHHAEALPLLQIQVQPSKYPIWHLTSNTRSSPHQVQQVTFKKSLLSLLTTRHITMLQCGIRASRLKPFKRTGPCSLRYLACSGNIYPAYYIIVASIFFSIISIKPQYIPYNPYITPYSSFHFLFHYPNITPTDTLASIFSWSLVSVLLFLVG